MAGIERDHDDLRCRADEVWPLLSDPALVASCIPGATLSPDQGDGLWRGSVRVKFGPTVAVFRGEATSCLRRHGAHLHHRGPRHRRTRRLARPGLGRGQGRGQARRPKSPSTAPSRCAGRSRPSPMPAASTSRARCSGNSPPTWRRNCRAESVRSAEAHRTPFSQHPFRLTVVEPLRRAATHGSTIAADEIDANTSTDARRRDRRLPHPVAGLPVLAAWQK